METLTFKDSSAARVRTQTIDGRVRIKSILGLALALRLGVIALFLSRHPPAWLFTRAPELASLAASLCHGRGLSSPFGGETGPSAFLAPGYPLLIALVFRAFGGYSAASAIAILALQTGFALLTVMAAMLIARSLFGARVATIAGLLGAVGLPLLWVPVIFWETSLTTLLLTGFVALALRCRRRPAVRLWIALGSLGGFSVLVNPALAPATLGILAWTAHQSRPAPIRWPLFSLLIVLAIFAPWPIRNAWALHHFIPLRSNFGFELYMGNRDGGNGDFDESLFPIENPREHADYVAKGEVAYMGAKIGAREGLYPRPPGRVCRDVRQARDVVLVRGRRKTQCMAGRRPCHGHILAGIAGPYPAGDAAKSPRYALRDTVRSLSAALLHYPRRPPLSPGARSVC
jgi:hypothetical protein